MQTIEFRCSHAYRKNKNSCVFYSNQKEYMQLKTLKNTIHFIPDF